MRVSAQKASKILGSRLKSAIEQKNIILPQLLALQQQFEQLSPASQYVSISELELRVQAMEGKPEVVKLSEDLKKIKSERENYDRLHNEITVLETKINEANNTIEKLKNLGMAYVQDASNPQRGNYKFVYKGDTSREISPKEGSIKYLLDLKHEIEDAAVRNNVEDLNRHFNAYRDRLKRQAKPFFESEENLANIVDSNAKRLEERYENLVKYTGEGAVHRVINKEANAARDYAMSYTDSVGLDADKKIKDSEKRQADHTGKIAAAQHKTWKKTLKYSLVATGAAIAIVGAGVAYNLFSKPSNNDLEKVQTEVQDLDTRLTDVEEKVTNIDYRLKDVEVQYTPAPTPTIPAAEGLNAVKNAFRYGFSKELAYDMYQSNPNGFAKAFGISQQAIDTGFPEKYFDGSNSNGEVLPLNGIGLNVDGAEAKARFYLFKLNAANPDDRAAATFNVTAYDAKKFTLDYLAQHPNKIAEVKILAPGN